MVRWLIWTPSCGWLKSTVSSSSKMPPRAIGAEHRGRRAGSIGHYGCFLVLSFQESRRCWRWRDGLLRTMRSFGPRSCDVCAATVRSLNTNHKIIGGNFRLDAIQAAIVSAKLAHLDDWTAARQRNAKRYDQLFADAGLTTVTHGSSPVTLPRVVTDRHSIFNQYVIRGSMPRPAAGRAKTARSRHGGLLPGPDASSRVLCLSGVRSGSLYRE